MTIILAGCGTGIRNKLLRETRRGGRAGALGRTGPENRCPADLWQEQWHPYVRRTCIAACSWTTRGTPSDVHECRPIIQIGIIKLSWYSIFSLRSYSVVWHAFIHKVACDSCSALHQPMTLRMCARKFDPACTPHMIQTTIRSMTTTTANVLASVIS